MIKVTLVHLLFFAFLSIDCTLYDCIKNSDRLKEKCAYECIQSCSCAASCDAHYVLSDCINICCECEEKIKIGLEKCDQMRSDYQNRCIESFCLDPWCKCPSCGMDF